MKQFFRLISLFLLLSLSLSLFAACGGQDVGGEESSDTDQIQAPAGTPPKEQETPPDEEAPDASDGISVEDLSQYAIVYPQDASESFLQIIQPLSAAFKTRFGILMESKSDFVNELSSTYRVGEYEILVGGTNREESNAFVAELKYKDYGYRLVGKKIVISGLTEDSLNQAVTAFISNVVLGHLDSEPMFMTEAKNKTVAYDYRHDAITLSGVSVSEYRIVYPAGGTAFEKYLAQNLSHALTEACGVLPLEVVPDTTAYADGYEILVGKTNRLRDYSAELAAGEGYYGGSGKLISLWGNTALGNVSAVQSFVDSFEKAEPSEALALTPVGGKTAADDDSTMRAMSYNVFAGKKDGFGSPEERKEAVAAVIARYLPDIAGLQEMHNDTNWKTVLTQEGFCGLLEYYDYIGYSCPEEANGYVKLANPILYAKEKYTAVEWGVKWLTDTPDVPSQLPGSYEARTFVWAIFERKSDGLRFMVINTHLDTEGQTIRLQEQGVLYEFMQEHSNLPLMMMGDFNTQYSGLYPLLEYGGLTDSKDMAKTVDDQKATGIDFILFRDAYADVSAYWTNNWKPFGVEPSDHKAIWCDFSLDAEGDSEIAEKTPIALQNLDLSFDMEGAEFGQPTWFEKDETEEFDPIYPSTPKPEPEPEPEPKPEPEPGELPMDEDSNEDGFRKPNWFA